MDDSKPDPIDPKLLPLMQSLGRAVLGAAVLEKILLVDIARRHTEQEGLSERLAQLMTELEPRPAGDLLQVLRRLGLREELAERIRALIRRRNYLVHRFTQDPEVMAAFITGSGLETIVGRIDDFAIDTQQLINEIAPPAFAGAEAVFGISLTGLLEMAASIDLNQIEDQELRAQLLLARSIDPAELGDLGAGPS
jgi:hypothetical protein